MKHIQLIVSVMLIICSLASLKRHWKEFRTSSAK